MLDRHPRQRVGGGGTRLLGVPDVDDRRVVHQVEALDRRAVHPAAEQLLERLRELNVRSVRVACTHGLFASGALKRIGDQPDVLEIVCTNSVPIPESERNEKLTVLSIAPALAEAVRRIHNGESVSALFEAGGPESMEPDPV